LIIPPVWSESVGSSDYDSGLFNAEDGPATITILNSVIIGNDYNIYNQVAVTVKVGNTELMGPIQRKTGDVFKCIGCYDGNLNGLGNECQ
jgi:hypothetical protein